MWVATALAPGLSFITRCGFGVVGLLEELGCWSVEAPLCGFEFSRSAGVAFSVPGVLPVVPMVEGDGWESFCPEAPVVEVVLPCWSLTVVSGTFLLCWLRLGLPGTVCSTLPAVDVPLPGVAVVCADLLELLVSEGVDAFCAIVRLNPNIAITPR